MTSNRFLGGLAAAFATIALAAAPALAQKAPPAKTAPTAAKTTKTASPCKGLTQASCGANKACAWISPKKAVDKRGRKLKAYCRKIAGIAKKKK